MAIVHGLKHGAAVCGIKGVPRDWPEGHTWVAALLTLEWPLITCTACRQALGLTLSGMEETKGSTLNETRRQPKKPD